VTTPELIAYLAFAAYLVAFLALTRRISRTGTDPWLFARGGGTQTVTGWMFRLGFALLLAQPLVHSLAPGLALRLDPWPPTVAILGAALATTGGVLALWAQAHMGGSWRIGAAEGRVGTLVADGPFAYSRNPVFVGQIALVWGLFLASGDALVAILAGAVTLAALLQASVEERVLLASLGPEYRNYVARVPRWFGWPRAVGDAPKPR
jgi:protein-S-isoprenylcysteine O-methyltransferase Ste14